MIFIETTSSLMSLSIPACTTSSNLTSSPNAASLTKWLLCYFTDAYLSFSVIQITTVTLTWTVCTCPSNL